METITAAELAKKAILDTKVPDARSVIFKLDDWDAMSIEEQVQCIEYLLAHVSKSTGIGIQVIFGIYSESSECIDLITSKILKSILRSLETDQTQSKLQTMFGLIKRDIEARPHVAGINAIFIALTGWTVSEDMS